MKNNSWASALNVQATRPLSVGVRANPIATRQFTIAPVGVIFPVIKQKSADGIVPIMLGEQGREGLNIRQEAARFISTHVDELAVKRGSES